MDVFTPAQLAERYGVSELTLTEWRYKGKGPRWFKAGKNVRYRKSAVDEWEAGQEAEIAAQRRAG